MASTTFSTNIISDMASTAFSANKEMVEPAGIEPATSTLPALRSPS